MILMRQDFIPATMSSAIGALGLDPDGDIIRYFGENAETELEVAVKAHFAWMSA